LKKLEEWFNDTKQAIKVSKELGTQKET